MILVVVGEAVCLSVRLFSEQAQLEQTNYRSGGPCGAVDSPEGRDEGSREGGREGGMRAGSVLPSVIHDTTLLDRIFTCRFFCNEQGANTKR